MSTVQITLTGLFLVVPTGNDFTILLPRSATHPHRPPIVGSNASIEDLEVDLTGLLPRGAENIPPDTTVPVKTLSGNSSLKPGLLTDRLPLPQLHGRIKLPKPHRIWPGRTSLFFVSGKPPLVASNQLSFEYHGHTQTSVTVMTRSGQETFNEIVGLGLIRVPFLHRAVHEPSCFPGIPTHHVGAYYELFDESEVHIPELGDPCLVGFESLAMFPEVFSALREDDRFLDVARRYRAATDRLQESLSTFTCLIGSGT
jgi:hypothetical protein